MITMWKETEKWLNTHKKTKKYKTRKNNLTFLQAKRKHLLQRIKNKYT